MAYASERLVFRCTTSYGKQYFDMKECAYVLGLCPTYSPVYSPQFKHTTIAFGALIED